MATPAGLELVGGEFSSFAIDEGNYHCEVSTAENGEASTGRKQLKVELIVRNDPNHPAKEGKKLTTLFQTYPIDADDADKAKMMRGFFKRLIFDGLLQEEWPKTGKAFDPRRLVGKQAWVQIRTNDRGESRVYAIASEVGKLPVLKKAGAPAAGAKGNAKSTPAAARR